MFPGIGTSINVIAIAIGAVLGKFGGNWLPQRTRILITDVLGIVTLLGAASALISLWNGDMDSLPAGAPILIVLGSLLIGGLIGSATKIEMKLESWGEGLKRRLSANSEGQFVEGFVTASLIFVIGPLAILGSISDGMSTGIEQLALKSTLDFFAAIAFAATFGWGVALSALPVGIYQGLWTVSGFFLGQLLDEVQIAAMTATGGVLVIGIALKLLNIRAISIGDLLPALAIAPILVTLVA